MNHDLTIVSNSDSSNSSYSWSGLSVLVRDIFKRLQGHPLGHLSPQARNIYLVAVEPGCDPWCEPLDSEFELEPCPYHTHCGCNWTDSYPEPDNYYCIYPDKPEAELRICSDSRFPSVQTPVPVSLVQSELSPSLFDSICFGLIQVRRDPAHPLSGSPSFKFCCCQHFCCPCEAFWKIEVSRTCILIDPSPAFYDWVQSYLKVHKLKF